MRRQNWLVLLALAAVGCSHAASEQKPDVGAPQALTTKPAPEASVSPPQTAQTARDTGRQKVHGGEAFTLSGAEVKVSKVVYVNQPCPKGAECIHSGIIKVVHFQVAHGGPEQQASVHEGQDAVVDGVQLRVFSVTEGPQAEIQASLALALPK